MSFFVLLYASLFAGANFGFGNQCLLVARDCENKHVHCECLNVDEFEKIGIQPLENNKLRLTTSNGKSLVVNKGAFLREQLPSMVSFSVAKAADGLGGAPLVDDEFLRVYKKAKSISQLFGKDTITANRINCQLFMGIAWTATSDNAKYSKTNINRIQVMAREAGGLGNLKCKNKNLESYLQAMSGPLGEAPLSKSQTDKILREINAGLATSKIQPAKNENRLIEFSAQAKQKVLGNLTLTLEQKSECKIQQIHNRLLAVFRLAQKNKISHIDESDIDGCALRIAFTINDPENIAWQQKWKDFVADKAQFAEFTEPLKIESAQSPPQKNAQ